MGSAAKMSELLEAANKNWDLVVSHLHFNGDNRKTLTTAQHWEVYSLGDGFGPLTLSAALEMGGDWSHVRDSSPGAIEAMASKIRELVAGMSTYTVTLRNGSQVIATQAVTGSSSASAALKAGDWVKARAFALQDAMPEWNVTAEIRQTKPKGRAQLFVVRTREWTVLP